MSRKTKTFSLDEKLTAANILRTNSMLTLIIGRLVVIFLLLVTSWVWHSGTLRLSFENIPQGLFLVFVISVGLTIVYFFLLRLTGPSSWQLRTQFILDALLITWLVWRTGDLSSPYIALYFVLISVASFFMRPLPTLLMAAFVALCLVILSALVSADLIVSSGATLPAGRAVQVVSFHVVALLVVGLLASRLADRRTSGEQLIEATRSLASLRALHERIVESIRSGLVTTDLDGRIFTFNSAATEITGKTSDQVIGRSLYEIFGDISIPVRISLDSVERGEQSPRFETDLMTPEGFAVRIGYQVSPLFSEDNEETGLILTFQDLTEIRSMEESIRRKDRLAAVGRVAAGLAHEIRNPLGAMRGAIQMLESTTEADSANASLMEIILKESDRLNGIITNFLSFARPAAAQFSETDINEMVSETVQLLRHSPDVRDDHKIDAATADEPLMIQADPAQLKQIFWNLSRNALSAMPNGGELRFAVEAMPNNRVRVVVTDTGCGMEPVQVERLFEPFAESTTGGTGLGLSIVYQIVRDHSGSINVRSLAGKGTTITIDLPCDPRVRTQESITRAEADSNRIGEFLNVGPEDAS